jgi:hypothetical protein
VAEGKGWQFRASLVATLVLGCAGDNNNQYAEAATGLGATIGSTAIYRAQTHGCWAVCSPGFACDRPSGLCRRYECVPACAPNKTCFIESDNSFRCVDVLGAGPFSAPTPAPIMSSAPVPSAAPPANSASAN